MSLVDRVKNILISPASEWEVIAKEPATVGGLFTGYAIPLMILPIIGQVVGLGLLGIGADSYAMMGLGTIGVVGSAVIGVVSLVLGIVLLYAMIFAVNTVSPSFNGKSDMVQSAKLMVYASTPSWVAGLIVPLLGAVGGLVGLAATAYVVYLIYTGNRPVLDLPQEKNAGFTVVTVLIYIVLAAILSFVIFGLLLTALLGGGMMAAGAASAL
jgi:Yip1 domain